MKDQRIIPSQVRDESSDEIEVLPDSVDIESKDQAKKFRDDEHKMRQTLMFRLTWISVSWLCFTAIIILLKGFPVCFFLSDSVMITFLTTSLGTVLGLWGIGLGYYFFVKR
jgi:hypothetical protein